MGSERLRISFTADVKFKLTISQWKKDRKQMCKVLIIFVWRETINFFVHI